LPATYAVVGVLGAAAVYGGCGAVK